MLGKGKNASWHHARRAGGRSGHNHAHAGAAFQDGHRARDGIRLHHAHERLRVGCACMCHLLRLAANKASQRGARTRNGLGSLRLHHIKNALHGSYGFGLAGEIGLAYRHEGPDGEVQPVAGF